MKNNIISITKSVTAQSMNAVKEECTMLPNILTADKHGTQTYDLVSEAFEKSRKIFLDTAIDAECAANIILQLEYLDKISDDDITMYINSPGGSVSAGLAIVDAMARCRSDIVTVCTGLAASMGSVVLACGTRGKRYATPYSEVLIHQPLIMGGMGGQATEIEIQAKHIVHSKEVLMKILAERSGQDIAKVTADCDRDRFLTSDEAVDYGIVDKIYAKGTDI